MPKVSGLCHGFVLSAYFAFPIVPCGNMILGDSSAMLLAAGFAGPIRVFLPFDFLDVGCDFHWLCSRYQFSSPQNSRSNWMILRATLRRFIAAWLRELNPIGWPLSQTSWAFSHSFILASSGSLARNASSLNGDFLFISLAVRTMGIRRGWLACRLVLWRGCRRQPDKSRLSPRRRLWF